jgi:hypothetical protein
MVRIGTGSRLGPAQVRPVRTVADATERTGPAAARAPTRALVVIDGGRTAEEPEKAAAADPRVVGRSRAGFIAQLLTANDPTLLPSRLERTRAAAACYAEAARRLA